METGIRHTHLLTVILFLAIYLIKTILLLINKKDALAKFTKGVKVPEMIISTLFLVTGIYLLTVIPEIKSLMIIKIAAVVVSIPLAIIGFKKQNKMLAVISLLLLIGAYGLAEMSKKQKSKAMKTISETNINAEELFIASCANCHGADGKLGLMGSKDLTKTTMNMEARIEIIKNGKNAMTPFAGNLTEDQIKVVAAYIDSLKE